jgi:hypothetical protein
MAIGNFDVAPAFERREQHEKIGSTVAFVFVIMTGRAARFHRHGNAGLGNKLL